MLFPSGPNLGAIANCGLFAVSDDGRFHEGRVIKDFVFLGPFVVHVLHQRDLFIFTVPVNKIIDTAFEKKEKEIMTV